MVTFFNYIGYLSDESVDPRQARKSSMFNMVFFVILLTGLSVELTNLWVLYRYKIFCILCMTFNFDIFLKAYLLADACYDVWLGN